MCVPLVLDVMAIKCVKKSSIINIGNKLEGIKVIKVSPISNYRDIDFSSHFYI